ncbi:MAG: hypothetical protein H6733_17930, partial [Alphaproteobacteria bacterium]|nr:hypothetical protein [Alphaproteobacteria bacterium]
GSAEVTPGDPVAPGAHLKFGVDLPAAGAARLVALSDGTLVTLWPRPQDDAAPLPAGDAQVLPGAVELDDAPGAERLFLLHCPGASTMPDCPLEGAAPTCPAGCTVTERVLEKKR